MSELINNRENKKINKNKREERLKKIIKDLHNGKSVEEVKEEFETLIKNVSVNEISEMEAALIKEGMEVEEIQRLCDVHAEVFKGSIEEIHRDERPENSKGHPIYTLKMENLAIENLLNKNILQALVLYKKKNTNENLLKLLEEFNLLWDIDKHYSRKENILFPYMEKYKITAPPKVMWAVDDEIRRDIKEIKDILINFNGDIEVLEEKINIITTKILDMIFKEENILFPLLLETLTEDEWVEIMEDSDEIGYCLIDVVEKWKPQRMAMKYAKEDNRFEKEYIKLDTGILNIEELSAIFNHLPVDITFIDKDDVVKYFSQSQERIFARTKSVIGRTVQNCHPPASVHIVEQMLKDFKSGKKHSEEFWIKMGELYVYIRYFAIKNEKDEYMGTLEVTQNIKSIQEITGEKRLLSQ